MDKLSHINESGEIQMVNIEKKKDSRRIARASAEIIMNHETLVAINQGSIAKGNVFATAKIAGIMAAKHTWDLIPLCHQIPINSIEINFTSFLPNRIIIESSVNCYYHTGVEMEALTACTIAALTVYDMIKAIDKCAVINNIHLVEKSGGKSGHFIVDKGDIDA